jgi:serine/threonine-protein kinase OSR1/STK39
MMLSCKHPNLVKEYATFMCCNYMWIVMNILDGGSLADIMTIVRDPVTNKKGFDDEVLIATLIKETMKALQYFHTNGKIHRDIKAGNILLDMEGNVYLSDFGVSASLKKGQKRGTLVGSPCWMAPEIMSQTGHEFNADVWSLGITA